MMQPLTTWQKLIAYASLAVIICCTLFFAFIIWMYFRTMYQ